ncbi:hypothetical protein KZZ52_51595 [Dactylosporangium sp. AC04546]|uniref:GTP pyrophosphokinase n=1 Tax=Dactylosporangium sp. AC04546 TaxID=2862460 RepID=UPI001EE0E23D|nr:hypothetical protein [Dactylosporangium sp. AC04546]WVK82306.1 hypothetical protein KZZ52_51595 [Dactylosporangium sp. AC04546]
MGVGVDNLTPGAEFARQAVVKGMRFVMTYEDLARELEMLGLKLQQVLTELLVQEGVGVHSINFRIKSRSSAEKKVEAKANRYGGIEDLKDLLGVRIITYFADDVDRVADVIEREFDIDYDHSVDKRELLEADAFGYASLHYVGALDKVRLGLTEYKRFGGRQFELQIRSILQHAWAEIEHDLGYKSESAIPRAIRRRFVQLSGLLELADDDFTRLRDSLRSYEKEVAELASDALAERDLDQTTLRNFASDRLVAELDRYVADQIYIASECDAATTADLDTYVHQLNVLGIYTVAQVQAAILRNVKDIARFSYVWIRELYLDEGERLPSVAYEHVLVSRGASLAYAILVIALREQPRQVAEILRYGNRVSSRFIEKRHRDLKKAWLLVQRGFEPPNFAGSDLSILAL